MKRPILRVWWRDAAHIEPGQWSDLAAKPTGARVESVGYLVRRTKRWLVLTQSLGPDDDGAGVFAIPRASIIRERIIK